MKDKFLGEYDMKQAIPVFPCNRKPNTHTEYLYDACIPTNFLDDVFWKMNTNVVYSIYICVCV